MLDHLRKPVTKKDRLPGPYPYYGATGIVDYVSDFLFDEPLVLVGEDGAKWASGDATAFAIAGPCWVNNHAHVLRPDRVTVLDEWLVHYLVHQDLSRYISGLTVPKLNQGSLREIPIPLPALSEQRRIVAILDEAFEGIATAKAHAEKNLRNARELMISHVENLLAEKLSAEPHLKLGQICDIKTGKKDVNQGNPEGEYPFFTCAARHTYSDEYSFDTEALLVAGNGNVGQVSYYKGKFEAYQRTYVLHNFRGVLAPYLYRLLDKRLSATVSKQKLGNTMPYIKIGMLTDFPVRLPTLATQLAISDSLEEFAEKNGRLIEILERKLAALDELKQSLLHQAFSGQL